MYCSFCSLDLCLHNQIVRRRHFKLGAGINVKDELKKKKKKKKGKTVRVLLRDKDLPEILNAMSEVKTFLILISNSKHSQDIRDSRDNKNHSLLNIRLSRHGRRTRSRLSATFLTSVR